MYEMRYYETLQKTFQQNSIDYSENKRNSFTKEELLKVGATDC